MKQKGILVFSKKEEELVNTLISFGIKRTAARALVYLLHRGESTMKSIELGTGLSQPEVSTALKYMKEQGWVLVSAAEYEGKGRPKKTISLAISARDNLRIIDKGKKIETKDHQTLLRKTRAIVA